MSARRVCPDPFSYVMTNVIGDMKTRCSSTFTRVCAKHLGHRRKKDAGEVSSFWARPFATPNSQAPGLGTSAHRASTGGPLAAPAGSAMCVVFAAHVRRTASQPRYPHHAPSQSVACVCEHNEAIWESLQKFLGGVPSMRQPMPGHSHFPLLQRGLGLQPAVRTATGLRRPAGGCFTRYSRLTPAVGRSLLAKVTRSRSLLLVSRSKGEVGPRFPSATRGVPWSKTSAQHDQGMQASVCSISQGIDCELYFRAQHDVSATALNRLGIGDF